MTQYVYIETVGCQMNVLDSQLVEGQLRALGLRPIGCFLIWPEQLRRHAPQQPMQPTCHTVYFSCLALD